MSFTTVQHAVAACKQETVLTPSSIHILHGERHHQATFIPNGEQYEVLKLYLTLNETPLIKYRISQSLNVSLACLLLMIPDCSHFFLTSTVLVTIDALLTLKQLATHRSIPLLIFDFQLVASNTLT